MTTTDVRSSAIEALAGRIFSTGCGQAARPGGTVLVVDERAAASFTAPGDEIERFFAAASAIWGLPQGRVGPDPEPVGTLIRPAAMLDLARRAGYADGQILPIEHPVWRFYRLVP